MVRVYVILLPGLMGVFDGGKPADAAVFRGAKPTDAAVPAVAGALVELLCMVYFGTLMMLLGIGGKMFIGHSGHTGVA